MIQVFMVLWLCGWILAIRFRRAGRIRRGAAATAPSIIIPARDEAHNLPRLLRSLAAQNVRPVEVLVVDDGSSDGTAAVAREHGATVIASQPLPAGWRGKTWACHQGALAARGGRLLFLDADTWFEPGGLDRLLSIDHAGVLSVVPYHAVQRAYEGLSLFFNLCMAAGTIPHGLAGQVLLVDREDYQAAGGHASVRGQILENFQLAGGFRGAGIPVASLTGKGIVSFRMYPQGVRQLVAGWAKGFAAGSRGTPPGILMLVIAWLGGLALVPVAGALSGEWMPWGAAWLGGALQVAWIGRKLGAFGWLVLLFYPLPLVFFFGLFGWSALRTGKSVRWKGREIHGA